MLGISPTIALFAGLGLVPILLVSCVTTYLLFFFQPHTERPSLKEILQNALHPAKNTCYKPLYITIGLTLLYMLIASSWSMDPTKSAILWVRIIAMFALTTLSLLLMPALPSKHQQALWVSLGVGTLIAIILANFDTHSRGILTDYLFHSNPATYNPSSLNRGSVYISLCLWPLLYILLEKRRWLLSLFFTLLTLYIVSILESATAILGLYAGLTTFILCTLWRKCPVKLIACMVALGILATPVIAYKMQPVSLMMDMPRSVSGSVRHRIFIWHFAAHKSMQAPWFGAGFDEARHISDHHPGKVPYNFGMPETVITFGMDKNNLPSLLPLHTHNGTLQIFLELGVAGLLLYTLLVVFAGAAIEKTVTAPKHKAFYATLLVQYVVLQQTGFGIWQNWFIASGLLALILLRIAMQHPALPKKQDTI